MHDNLVHMVGKTQKNNLDNKKRINVESPKLLNFGTLNMDDCCTVTRDEENL